MLFFVYVFVVIGVLLLVALKTTLFRSIGPIERCEPPLAPFISGEINGFLEEKVSTYYVTRDIAIQLLKQLHEAMQCVVAGARRFDTKDRAELENGRHVTSYEIGDNNIQVFWKEFLDKLCLHSDEQLLPSFLHLLIQHLKTLKFNDVDFSTSLIDNLKTTLSSTSGGSAAWVRMLRTQCERRWPLFPRKRGIKRYNAQAHFPKVDLQKKK